MFTEIICQVSCVAHLQPYLIVSLAMHMYSNKHDILNGISYMYLTQTMKLQFILGVI